MLCVMPKFYIPDVIDTHNSFLIPSKLSGLATLLRKDSSNKRKVKDSTNTIIFWKSQ